MTTINAHAGQKLSFIHQPLQGLFNGEDGRILLVSMEKLALRITRDRGGMSSLIDNLDALNDAYRQIDLGNPIQMPVLNSRRRSLKDQLLIEAGRHQLYALRNRGINEIPVVVPEGLLLQAEMELGITDLNAAAGVRQVATSAGKASAA